MRGIWRLALNDVRLTLRDRPALIWMLVLPLAMMWLFGNAFRGGGGGTPQVSLTVVDHDGGWLARAFVEELRDESIRMTELTSDEHAATGSATRVRSLIVPAGFTEAVLAGERQVLRLEQEAGSNREFGLAGQMHIVRTIVRTVGRLIELETGVDAARFAALGEREPPVRLEVSQAGAGRPVPSGFNQSVPGILTMIVLMMTLIYGAVFLTVEKQTGMLRRQQALPLGRMQIYLGKLGGRLLIAGMQLVALVLLGGLLFPMDWGGSPFGLVLLLGSFAVAVSGLATLLGALLHTPAQASAVGWLGSMGMAGLGGCWWPAEVMPEWLRTASRVLPTAWVMDGLHRLISFGDGLGAVLLPSGVLLGFGVVFALLGARFLRFD
jgi:ABC-type multidrug transport system permease subunit